MVISCVKRTVQSVLLFLVVVNAAFVSAQPLDLILPTSNRALLEDDGPAFYQFTDRYFKGKRSHPWEGGQYGFVRNQVETQEGVVFTRFHEGVDIKPLYRDRRGEPLDTVRAIDDGVVVYVNPVARASTYGIYVVVEHIWSGSPFYSLYAHLGDAYVRKGQRVCQGDRLGRMGYTGRGIDKRRAHVHFEINMLLNREFDAWHDRHYKRSDKNEHGIFNGVNMAGLDVAALYLALRDNPTLTIEQFLWSQEIYFTVIAPISYPMDLLYRYPWLSRRGYKPDAPSVEISLTRSGLPVRVESTYRRVPEAVVSKVKRSNVPYQLISNSLLTGSYGDCSLSKKGHEYIELLAMETRPDPKELEVLRTPGPPAKVPVKEVVSVTEATHAIVYSDESSEDDRSSGGDSDNGSSNEVERW